MTETRAASSTSIFCELTAILHIWFGSVSQTTVNLFTYNNIDMMSSLKDSMSDSGLTAVRVYQVQKIVLASPPPVILSPPLEEHAPAVCSESTASSTSESLRGIPALTGTTAATIASSSHRSASATAATESIVPLRLRYHPSRLIPLLGLAHVELGAGSMRTRIPGLTCSGTARMAPSTVITVTGVESVNTDLPCGRTLRHHARKCSDVLEEIKVPASRERFRSILLALSFQGCAQSWNPMVCALGRSGYQSRVLHSDLRMMPTSSKKSLSLKNTCHQRTCITSAHAFGRYLYFRTR